MKLQHNTMVMILVIGLLIGAIVVYKTVVVRKKDYLFTIGILQTASHPALDAVREGFMTEIKDAVGDKIDCVVRNGQGSIISIHTIAEQFHAKQDIDAIFAIATPAAQAALSLEKEKPVIIAAVTVAPELGINFIESNVCGVSDMIDVRKEVEAMTMVLPREMQTVGILYCTAEVNSVAMSQIMVAQLERAGYMPVLVGVTSEADIEPAILSAARKVDAFLAPTDNVVANTITLIVDLTHKAHKPLIVSDNMLVKYGALMARGVDYYESGRQAGAIALQVLMQHKKPQDLPIASANNKDIFVNKKVLDELGLTIADAIAQDVVLV
jgi:putative ABC transport system substrate-binding protein